MVTNNYVETEDFILLLKRAWSSSDQMFFDDDEAVYKSCLIDFCNSTHSYNFSENDYEIIYSFLKKTIHTYIKFSISDSPNKDSILKDTLHFLNLTKYMSIFCNNKLSKAFFSETLYFLLSFPIDNNLSPSQVDSLFTYYEDSSLFFSICESTGIVTSLTLEDTVLSNFMQLLRRRPQLNLFTFYLYQFNPRFFRHNNKVYPDECSPKEIFYGITSFYFSSDNSFKECSQILLEQCSKANKANLFVKSYDNPLFVVWRLHISSHFNSITEFSSYFELLFNN